MFSTFATTAFCQHYMEWQHKPF